MTKVEVFHDRKALSCLQSNRALHSSEIDVGIEGYDQPFLQPGYRASKLYSCSLDQGLREKLAD
jgi:hypothetical protein